MFSTSLLAFQWYWLDSELRGYRRSIPLNVSVVALAGIALPYYLFRSRGVKGGFVGVGLLVLLFVVAAALIGVGQLTVYYFWQS